MDYLKLFIYWILPLISATTVGLIYLMSNYDLLWQVFGVCLFTVVTISLIYDHFTNQEERKEIEKPFEDV